MDDASAPPATLSISRAHDPVLERGKRDSLTNRDLLTADATGGGMLAIVTAATEGMGPPSGWHYHPCDYQLILVQKGWVDIEVEGGTRTRLEQGDSILLPGKTRHNVSATADVLETLTVTVPAMAETIMCDPPSANGGTPVPE